MFKEDNYVGNYGDADGYDVNAGNIDRSLDFLNAGLTYLSYQVGTDSAKNYKTINKDSIMKKLKWCYTWQIFLLGVQLLYISFGDGKNMIKVR